MKNIVFLTLLLSLAIPSYAVLAAPPCTTCHNCSEAINEAYQPYPSVTTMLNDIVANDSCINLYGKENVTLNCNGFSIIGNFSGYAIFSNSSNTLRNFKIINCPSISQFEQGIHIENAYNITVQNVTIYTITNNEGYGIFYNTSNHLLLDDLDVYSNRYGLFFENSYSVDIYDAYVYDNSRSGVHIDGSSFDLSNMTISDNVKNGIEAKSGSSTFVDINLLNNEVGLYIYGPSSDNYLRNSYILGNSYGIFLSVNLITSSQPSSVILNPEYNHFYNNYFNNTINAYAGDFNNYWNTNLDCNRSGISGSACYGGNFWLGPNATGFSETCTDLADPKGICDDNYSIDSYNSDHFALSMFPNTNPNITLNGPVNSYSQYSGDLMFNWTAYDNEETTLSCDLTINNVVRSYTVNNASAYNVSIAFSVVDDYVWNVTCHDSHGGLVSSATRSFSIDAVPVSDDSKTSTISVEDDNETIVNETIDEPINDTEIINDTVINETVINDTVINETEPIKNDTLVNETVPLNDTLSVNKEVNDTDMNKTLNMTIANNKDNKKKANETDVSKNTTIEKKETRPIKQQPTKKSRRHSSFFAFKKPPVDITLISVTGFEKGSNMITNLTIRILNATLPDDVPYLDGAVKYVNITVQNKEVENATIEFGISAKLGTNITLYRFHDNWTALHTEFVRTDGDINYFKASIPGFSYFAIVQNAATSAVNGISWVLKWLVYGMLFVVVIYYILIFNKSGFVSDNNDYIKTSVGKIDLSGLKTPKEKKKNK